MTVQTANLPTIAGLHDVMLEIGNANCKATVQVPADTTSASLVLILHYGGPPQGFYGRALIDNLFLPAWRHLNAVMIAPVSQGGEWTTPENTAAALNLVAAVEAAYGCDPRRRVVGGYSLGAMGTWHLLAQQPDYFSAAVPIAGRVPSTFKPTTTPCYVLHSNADQLFAASEVTQRLAERVAHGAEICSRFLDGVDHYATGAYLEALGEVSSWLEEIWSRTR